MPPRTLIAVLTLAFFTQVSLAVETIPVTEPPRFIDTVGKHTPMAGLEVNVFSAPEGLLNYRITSKNKTGGPTKANIRKNSGWFIYAASPNDVWIYRGGDSISRILFSENQIKFEDYTAGTNKLRKAPQEFRDRLPARPRK